MSDLREQLADRLSAASGLEYSDDYPDTFEPFLSMADECIRQMEWARRFYIVSSGATPIVSLTLPDGTRVKHQTLTLAPEDWQP